MQSKPYLHIPSKHCICINEFLLVLLSEIINIDWYQSITKSPTPNALVFITSFEVGRYHSSYFIGEEHRHRQNKPKAILSPLSRGPAWDSNRFSRVLTIITALQCAKHRFQQLVTSTTFVHQASGYQGWCTGRCHVVVICKVMLNPTQTPLQGQAWSVFPCFLSPPAFSNTLLLQWKSAVAPLIT